MAQLFSSPDEAYDMLLRCWVAPEKVVGEYGDHLAALLEGFPCDLVEGTVAPDSHYSLYMLCRALPGWHRGGAAAVAAASALWEDWGMEFYWDNKYGFDKEMVHEAFQDLAVDFIRERRAESAAGTQET